ncbi:retrovirus-related pol polyprotein from transposon TNT 1-94 [Tanacetum coccineum]
MLKTSLICLLSKASKTKNWLWHRRLSHINFVTLNKLPKDGLARGIQILKFHKDHLCSACALGKSKKYSHQPKAEDTNQEKLYLLHMDLCDPMRVVSINGKRSKDEAPEAIIKCIKDIQVCLNATVCNVRTDNGNEFVNETLREFYENVGISYQTSVARIPQQNSVVERRNQTLVEAARTMLIFSNAPLFLWAEAINTACYTQNCSLIRLRYNKTPYELMQDKKPDLSFFYVFDSLCYPTNDNDDLGPGLHPMTPTTSSSRLVSNPVFQQPCILPKRDDWDRLFQPMFNEYFNPPSINVSPVQEVVAPRAVVLADSPVSTSIDQDAPSTSIPSTQEQEHSPNISQGTEEQREGTEEKVESTVGQIKGTEDQTKEEIASKASQTSTQTPTSMTFGDDETIATLLLNMSKAKAASKEKEKGVELKDVEEIDRPRPTSTRSLLTLKPLPKIDPKDKGKKKIEEEDESESEDDDIPQAVKKFKQLESDEEMARKIQEEWEAEEERNKIAEEKATNEALIKNFDDIKARIEADRILAEKLQEQEREQFTIEERAKFLHDTIAAQRKFLARQRSEAIRNRPPTKNQLRNQMMTYLKHVGNFKHSELKSKKFEDIQAMYEKIKRSDEDFIAIGSVEDDRLIKRMNKKDSSKGEEIKQESKEEVKEEDKGEENTRKRKHGTRKKMKSRKRRFKQDTSQDDPSDIEKENDELRLCLTIAPDEDKEVDYEILDKKYPIIDWKTENLGTKPQFDESKRSEEINMNVVTRSNGQKRCFSTLIRVLSVFDREDLDAIYKLVMDIYQDKIPEGFDKVLWGDLIVMFNPDEQDEFWNSQHEWKVVSWKLHSSSGVHTLMTDEGLVIQMLIEEVSVEKGNTDATAKAKITGQRMNKKDSSKGEEIKQESKEEVKDEDKEKRIQERESTIRYLKGFDKFFGEIDSYFQSENKMSLELTARIENSSWKPIVLPGNTKCKWLKLKLESKKDSTMAFGIDTILSRSVLADLESKE